MLKNPEPRFEPLPPEINSGNMYAGPGLLPMIVAAIHWYEFSSVMDSFTLSFDEMLKAIREEWSGPVVEQVLDAAAPFRDWLQDLGDEAYETFEQIGNINHAYVYAYGAVVPPQQIDANRASTDTLCEENEFGQHNAAIAALEEEYQKFWAQDVETMKWYRRRLSDALSSLTPWEPPPRIVDETGFIQPVPLDADAFSL